ncbi:hypothetical protein [Hymenobacter jejuensis]|uniref:Uncharacterized protein n=1 Tax=Hymenobacter jejuensis TaxID=2502781 RepID=A0A5B7ZXH7_9BACT|nr:hypothetical protein [Hymenobacter jejuensis]QDA59216.1 hypothetical protein FHG12_03435 [Hymenobacter jejuensis]
MQPISTDWLVSFSKIFYVVSELTIFLPLVVAFRPGRNLAPAFVPLRWFCVARLVLFVLSELAKRLLHYNIALLHLGTLLDSLLLGWLFYNFLASATIRYWLRLAGVAFVAFAFADSLLISGLWQRNAYTVALQTIGLLCLSLLYFEQMLRSVRHVEPKQDPMFLVSVGVALYYAGTVGLYLLENMLIAAKLLDDIWLMFNVSSVLTLILYGFLSKALLLVPSSDSTSVSEAYSQ